jgi:SNF2 family DNA or RNA helicase
LDVIDDATAVRKCGHAACRSCLFQVLSRRGSAASCPVCRVGIESKKDLITLPRMGGSRFPMNLRTNWQSSAKLDALMEDVREMEKMRTNSNFAVGKTVIMSQFTSFLDLLEIALGLENIRFLRFDGTLSQKNRALILDSFAKDNEMNVRTANVMLMSLKSGGVGLNLVSAARLCLADPSWNPQVDYQAMARVHRHGQTRDVVIKRYVISNSVEERLLDVQQRKVDVSEGALSTATDDDKRQARLSEIKMLFS